MEADSSNCCGQYEESIRRTPGDVLTSIRTYVRF